MIPVDMVSVCPLCTQYKKCVFSPCLYPFRECDPLALRLQDYKEIAKDCYSDKFQASENGLSGGLDF